MDATPMVLSMYCVVLIFQVEAMAREGKYEHLIIESTGISDPTPVAEALATSTSSSSSNGGDGFSAESGVSEGYSDDINVKASAKGEDGEGGGGLGGREEVVVEIAGTCLLYTSDAADE